jgi:ATP/maltotriose-dependent transcriptional regulator MalT
MPTVPETPAQRLSLLRTKLHPPTVRPELVAREATLAELVRGPLPRLVVVSAPPGWGKSTLLAQWSETDAERSFGWVSLDGGDDDPMRFWTYVLAAAEPHVSAASEIRQRLVNAPPQAFAQLFLPGFVNALAELDRRLVLVLDDYHLISNPDVHEVVRALVEHLPPTTTLVLATRADPPLPLARMRGRAELIEIRVDSLRFSTDEAGALLDSLGLELDASDVDRLERRTEGWAAGIYLAALSMRDRADRKAFISAFAGDDRHLVDYLGAEVLASQPDAVRDFLLRTSVLERFCGSLCDAVLDTVGSATTIAEIERSNLFVVSLDSKREWYRYHHLFGELLRHELAQREPELVPVLHRRASTWLREHGLLSLAIHHAIAAGEVSDAADLIALNWNATQNLGRLETVAHWLDSMPPDVVRADARLCVARTGNMLTLGRREEVEEWAEAAERAGSHDGPRIGAATVEAETNIYRAVCRYMLGDLTGAEAAARRAVEIERDDASPWRAMALAALGRTLYWLGQTDEAAGRLEDAIRDSQPGANSLSVTGALGYLALIRVEQGDAAESERLATDAASLSEECGFGEHWVTMIAELARGRVLLERGDAIEAEAVTGRAVELSRRGAGPVETALALIGHAEARLALGDRDGARSMFAEARGWIDRCAEPEHLRALVQRCAAPPRQRSRTGDRDELSERELSVLRLLGGSMTLREIGSTLFISLNTVKTHARSIYRKLGVSTREEAVERARELDLV